MRRSTTFRSLLCTHAGIFLVFASYVATPAQADDWPQWRGPNRDGTWNETGLVSKFASDQLTHKWSVEIGPGYSGPTVANGRVFITDRLIEPKQIERVHCFNEQTGESIWTHSYDCMYRGVGYEAGPRAAVTVADNRAFALGSMGYLHVFDAATGEVLWHRKLNEDFEIEMPIWGIAAAPLVYGESVVLHIGGAKGACLVALNVATGEEVWRSMDDPGSYSAPIIIRQAGQDVLVVWTGANIAGLDPNTGTVHWKVEMLPRNMVINIATPVFDPALSRLFVTSFYDGSMMLQLKPDQLEAEPLWRRIGDNERNTDALHSIMTTPLMKDGTIYGVDSYGELRGLESDTGDRIWEDKTATSNVRWGNIHMVQNDDKVWMFNERGELLISRLTPTGFEEISRAKLIDPTTDQLNRRGKGVCWSHPAFANRHVFARNDRQLVCAPLEK